MLVNHAGEVVAREEQMGAVPRQNREFVSAVMEGREPRTGVPELLPSWRTLDRLERSARESTA